MRLIANLAKTLRLKGDWQDWLDLIDQFGYSLFAEMNYLQEGRHADRLRRILRNFPTILIPRIIWRYSGRRVLTEELCEGTKIDNLGILLSADLDLKRLARQLVEAYLEQIFVHGFFHADPHSGNFAVTPTGEMVIYDFGMVSYLTAVQRLGLLNLVVSVVKDDINAFICAFEQLGILPKCPKRASCSWKNSPNHFLPFVMDLQKLK